MRSVPGVKSVMTSEPSPSPRTKVSAPSPSVRISRLRSPGRPVDIAPFNHQPESFVVCWNCGGIELPMIPRPLSGRTAARPDTNGFGISSTRRDSRSETLRERTNANRLIFRDAQQPPKQKLDRMLHGAIDRALWRDFKTANASQCHQLANFNSWYFENLGLQKATNDRGFDARENARIPFAGSPQKPIGECHRDGSS